MDCLARAFAHATHTDYAKLVKDIGHSAPYHIQEIIEVLGSRFSITEVSCSDIDPTCPYTPERIQHWIAEYSGVLAYWTGLDKMHAVAYNHKNGMLWDNGTYRIPSDFYTIFWIVEPRPFRKFSDTQ